MKEREAFAEEAADEAYEAGKQIRTCCGMPMILERTVFGVAIYGCGYRSHHPRVYRNLATGEEISEDGDECGT